MKSYYKLIPNLSVILLLIPLIFIEFTTAYIVGMLVTVYIALIAAATAENTGKAQPVFGVGNPKTNRGVDVSDEGRIAPKNVMKAIGQLEVDGFRRLGETATEFEDGRELGVEWCLISDDGQVVVAFVPVPTKEDGYMAQLVSKYPGHAWLITMYPTGFPTDETIESPDFRLHHVRSSLADACAHHRQEMIDFGRLHGSPLTIQTNAENIAFSMIFRELHIEKFLRRPLLMNALTLWVPFGLVITSMLLTLFTRIAPDVGLVLLMVNVSALHIFRSWTLPVPYAIARRFRFQVVMLFVILPVILIYREITLMYLLLLWLLVAQMHTHVFEHSKLMAEAIQSGELTSSPPELHGIGPIPDTDYTSYFED